MTDPYYVTISTDVDGETLAPDVIGPFPDVETACTWLRSLKNCAPPLAEFPQAIVLRPPDGGYERWAIIGPDTATPPSEYQHWADDTGDIVPV